MALESLFFEIGSVIVVAAVFSYVASLLKQPLIIAYILSGIVVGPSLLSLTKSSDVFTALSEIGIAFLLFTVGLGLNWRRIREVGTVAVASGVAQVLFTSLVGFVIAIWLGFDATTSIFISIAFSFSSTIIIVKLLMDKEDLDALWGKISVGFLLVQDLIAMVILLMLGALKEGGSITQILTVSIAKGALALVVLWLLATLFIPRLLRYAARSQELLLLFSLGWCFAVAGVLMLVGFGIEIGALVAGISLSGTVYEREIHARMRPLRDFFLVIFFIVLGTQFELSHLGSLVTPIIVFSLFVLIGNPLIMLLVMRALGYHPQTAFLVGTIVAQISEFSFIMLGAGVAAGLVNPSALTVAALVGLVTFAVCTYLVKYNEQLYDYARPYLRWLEPQRMRHEERTKRHAKPQVILFGYHRMGQVLLREVAQLNKHYLVVDYDPLVVDELEEKDVPVVYGDASDEEFLADLQAERAHLIISTIPDAAVSLELLQFLQKRGYRGVAIVTVKALEEIAECYRLGATYVIVPSVLGAKKFQELLRKNRSGMKSWKKLVKTETVRG
jgi:Kef-type K+ transport system membrane component KefB